MTRILARFVTRIKGAGILTFVGDRANQAIYWEALCYDPVKDSWWPPIGSLQLSRTHTDKTCLSTNGYSAPIRQPRIRWGTHYTWGEKKWAEDWFVNDHVKARWSD